ncbi:MAG: histidine kinase N-terminal 7TM domain-containing protein [Dehalococcoidia bacterium]
MNEPYYIFYNTAMVLSLLASLYIMVLTWRRRDVPGASAMLVLAASTFIWTFGFFNEAHSTTLENQLFFNDIGYIGSMSVSGAWFIFALHYSIDNRIITGWKIALFCIMPLVTIIMVWTNNLHHLMWYDEHLGTTGSFTITIKTYGIFFWISLAYNYMLLIGGTIILLRRLFTGTRLYTGQAISLLIAVLLPLLWNVIYIFDLLPLPRKDLTPVMFAASGIAISLGVVRFQLLKAVPFARKFIIEQMGDGIMVFNMRHRLLEANPAALSILEADRNIIGKGIEQLYNSFPLLRRFYFPESSIELPWEVSGKKRIYELNTVTMRDNQDRQIGWLAILHDITERNRRELEYKTIIQTTADGFWLTDLDGQFLDVNDAYCDLIGYSRDELLKMSITDVEAFEKPETIAAHISGIKKRGMDRFETRHKRKDGEIIDVEISVNYLQVNGERMFVFVRDITGRKQAEEAQRQSAEKLVSAMNSTIEAIAMTVEMRDPYTAGHQRRVTRLACAIATYMNVPEHRISGLRLASLIHDIGKVRIPTEILTNPDGLSEAEFSMMKTHPRIGYEILKTIESPWPIARIVHQHHERIDGSGYPLGLSGDEIILEARILAVADVVEAMASHRPYRPALGIDKALDEIIQNRGILYDPEAVDACVSLFNEQGYTLE